MSLGGRFRGARWFAGSLVCCALWLLVFSARAGAAPTRGQTHFNAGRVAYQQGRFAEAAREFKAAYEIDHLPDLLYDVARSCHNLYLAAPDPDTLKEAIATYRRYINEFPDAPHLKDAIQALGELTVIASSSATPPSSVDNKQPAAAGAGETETDKQDAPAPLTVAPPPKVVSPPPAVAASAETAPPLVAPPLYVAPRVTPPYVPAPRKYGWVAPVVVPVAVGVATAVTLGLIYGLRHSSDSSSSSTMMPTGPSLGKVGYQW
jgi:hypothetical protein